TRLRLHLKKFHPTRVPSKYHSGLFDLSSVTLDRGGGVAQDPCWQKRGASIDLRTNELQFTFNRNAGFEKIEPASVCDPGASRILEANPQFCLRQVLLKCREGRIIITVREFQGKSAQRILDLAQIEIPHRGIALEVVGIDNE